MRLGGNYNWMYVRIKKYGGDARVSAKMALNRIGAVFHEVLPSVPFEYRFADDEYEKKFAAEQRVGYAAGVFSVLAILISCLGLFGMAMYVAEQRTREIGVRKVLGASILAVGPFIARVCLVSWIVAADRRSDLLLGHAQLAPTLSLPHRALVVDLCVDRHWCHRHYAVDCELSGHRDSTR